MFKSLDTMEVAALQLNDKFKLDHLIVKKKSIDEILRTLNNAIFWKILKTIILE